MLQFADLYRKFEQCTRANNQMKDDEKQTKNYEKMSVHKCMYTCLNISIE